MPARWFSIRMRPGRALLGMTSDGTEPLRADSGEEVVVPEYTAAFLARQCAAEIIEVVDEP